MFDFTGSKCIVCGKTFTDDDNIVVCPECGTPYHNDCYKSVGKCTNTALHESHKEWTPDAAPEIHFHTYTENIVCKNCGFSNEPMAMFCKGCGMPLDTLVTGDEAAHRTHGLNGCNHYNNYNGNYKSDNNENVSGNQFGGIDIQPFLINFSDPLCGYNPQEDFDGVRLCELGDFVGENTHYYLPAFKSIKDTGRSMTWIISAMLFPELFFANRKMPLMALLCTIIRTISQIPYFITAMTGYGVNIDSYFNINSSAFAGVEMLSYSLLCAMMFFCGSYANYIYYRHAVRKTAKIKASVPPQMWRETLSRKGGTSAVWLTVFILLYIAMMILPAYLGFMLTMAK